MSKARSEHAYPQTVPARVTRALQLLPQPIASLSGRLKRELDSKLVYHSYLHTVDVIDQAIMLGSDAQLCERDLEIITIAALFHDAGFLKQHYDNEPIGAEMAETAMRVVGDYSQGEISLVSQMILDTKLIMQAYAQISNTRLSPYLLDADLSNLGRTVFWRQTAAVAAEIGIDFDTFMPNTRALMERHDWQSESARKAYGEQKEKNLKELELAISALQ
jgi:predicted metal-dependent HD superfamily phosphohydrolase